MDRAGVCGLRAGNWTNQLRAIWLAMIIMSAAGCLRMQLRNKQIVRKPGRHSLQLDNLLLLSDFLIPRDHSLVAELQLLRDQAIEALHLPPQRDQVTVYLFSDEASYRRYLKVTWPDLPDRRAYFVGTSRELAVYTAWGSRTREDLRHEYTHGVLHSTLREVPLWLDEGLAEYFEVAGDEVGGVNREHTTELAAAIANGWEPDMSRLESITEFSDLQRMDYQESWAWVHFMLDSGPDSRQVLIDYLHELRSRGTTDSLSDRLSELFPNKSDRLRAYVAGLQGPAAIIRAQTGEQSDESSF